MGITSVKQLTKFLSDKLKKFIITASLIFLVTLIGCNSKNNSNNLSDDSEKIAGKIIPHYDTLKSNAGKPNGFIRIRETINDTMILKSWFYSWDAKGNLSISFRENSKKNSLLSTIDSVFNKKGVLTRYEQQINEDFEGIQLLYDDNGILIRKDITLFINNKIITFQKYDYNNYLAYEALIDGNPPERIKINSNRFYEAENIINDKLLQNKMNK